MNDKQAAALIAGFLLIAFCALFPPRRFVQLNGTIQSGTPPRVLLEGDLYNNGFAEIDARRLLAECLAIASFCGAVLVAARPRR